MTKLFHTKTKNQRNSFRHIIFVSWLRIATNALFKLSEVLSEAAPRDTHRNKNLGATSTEDGRAYHNNCVKEQVPKIFPIIPNAIFHQFFGQVGCVLGPILCRNHHGSFLTGNYTRG